MKGVLLSCEIATDSDFPLCQKITWGVSENGNISYTRGVFNFDREPAMSEIIITYFMDKNLSICEHIGPCGREDVLRGIKQYYAGPVTKYAITDFTRAISDNPHAEELRVVADAMRKASAARPPYSCDLLIVPDFLKAGLSRV